MRRVAIIIAAGVTVAIALGALRRAFAPRLMERMAKDVMPRCMDACFARMPQERREFMLTHCRAQLDRIAERYMRDDRQQRRDPAEVA